MKVSVLIITYNEAICLRKAIESVRLWSDDIVILDSGSTDETSSIAHSYDNVRFETNEFVDFAAQRNFGLHSIAYKNEWLLLLDADETCSKELQEEITDAIEKVEKEVSSFIVRRKEFFNEKWVKIHSSAWFERLVRPKFVKFIGSVHEKLLSPGKQVRLQNYLYHFPFEKGIHHWITRHSEYAREMAQLELQHNLKLSIIKLFSPNPVVNARAIKALYLRLPGRWIIFLLHRLLLRGGLWGGIDSIHFTLLETFYHFLVVANVRSKRKIRP